MSVDIVKDYNGNIAWNVGSLFAHDSFIFKFVDVCKDLGVDHNISYVFGSIPCIFQGGRVAPRTATLSSALDILDEYANRGIGCRLTFSRYDVSESDLDDELSNSLLDKINDTSCDGVVNGVIVSSDKLALYIKERYPKLQVISSLVKPSIEVGLGLDSYEYYKSLFNLYDIVTVNQCNIHDGSFLKEMHEYRDRIELCVNSKCHFNCGLAGNHYKAIDKLNRVLLSGESYTEELHDLDAIEGTCLEFRKKYPLSGTSYSYSDIEMLVRMGFRNFRVIGREFNGECFVRDLGEYMFNSNIFTRVVHSIMNRPM